MSTKEALLALKKELPQFEYMNVLREISSKDLSYLLDDDLCKDLTEKFSTLQPSDGAEFPDNLSEEEFSNKLFYRLIDWLIAALFAQGCIPVKYRHKIASDLILRPGLSEHAELWNVIYSPEFQNKMSTNTLSMLMCMGTLPHYKVLNKAYLILNEDVSLEDFSKYMKRYKFSEDDSKDFPLDRNIKYSQNTVCKALIALRNNNGDKMGLKFMYLLFEYKYIYPELFLPEDIDAINERMQNTSMQLYSGKGDLYRTPLGVAIRHKDLKFINDGKIWAQLPPIGMMLSLAAEDYVKIKDTQMYQYVMRNLTYMIDRNREIVLPETFDEGGAQLLRDAALSKLVIIRHSRANCEKQQQSIYLLVKYQIHISSRSSFFNPCIPTPFAKCSELSKYDNNEQLMVDLIQDFGTDMMVGLYLENFVSHSKNRLKRILLEKLT